MAESVYRVTELVGTSTESWEKAAQVAIETASSSLRDLRIAEVVRLDLTVEEALVKFGFRYTTREDWGRLRRLFERAVVFKLVGGVLGTGLLLALAPAANSLLHKDGLPPPLLIAAFLPLAQCTENVGGVALILRGRYDIRAFFLFVSMALRFTAIAVGAPRGLTTTIAAIVAAQVVATAAISVAGWVAYRRFPQTQSAPLGEDRRGILSFVAQSSVATAVISLTAPLSLLVLGRVASTRQVAFFRAAILLGRTKDLFVPMWLAAASPAVGVLLYIGAVAFFHQQMRHYSSPGH